MKIEELDNILRNKLKDGDSIGYYYLDNDNKVITLDGWIEIKKFVVFYTSYKRIKLTQYKPLIIECPMKSFWWYLYD